VVRLADHFGKRGRAEVVERLTSDRPDRVLIQYVPHAYGMKAMNLPFARWVRRLRAFAPVWVMFHEAAFPFVRRPLKHNLIAVANRLMAWWIATAADRVFVTIPAWGDLLRRLAPKSPPSEWLPVPSNLPTDVTPAPKRATELIGHFGTYGESVVKLLEPALVGLLEKSAGRVALLLGRNGDTFRGRFVARHPSLAARVIATGELSATETAAEIAACDLMLQPYPDGVSSRRGSVMSGLALGVPMVTNLGPLSELIWASESSGVKLAPKPSVPDLIQAVEYLLARTLTERSARGNAGRRLYSERFALENTIAKLREERLL
jgi:glycosyltransferase involved in cell wall biosynthesis